MQIAPFYDHEHKNILTWDAFDYLHWIQNIEDDEELRGNEERRQMVQEIREALFNRIKVAVEKKNAP